MKFLSEPTSHIAIGVGAIAFDGEDRFGMPTILAESNKELSHALDHLPDDIEYLMILSKPRHMDLAAAYILASKAELAGKKARVYERPAEGTRKTWGV